MRYFFWGAVFFVLAYLVPIAGRPLHRPDEFRYAEIPREMLESGDFVTPRLLGERYFEKPVLGYWLVAGSFRIFGKTGFALRLPMALAAGLTALLVALWIRRCSRDPEWALWTALFYLSTALGWLLGTTAVLDGILCLFTTATLLCVHQAVMTEKWDFERQVWLVLAGVTAGLGFMTKGFVAWAVPGSAAVAWLIWTKRWKAFLWLPWIPLVALAATVLPWALEIHRAEPDFWRYFVIVEHFQRFKSGAETQHPQPFWFYVPVLLGTIFPAAVTVFPAFAAGREIWKKVWRNDLWRFAFCGFLLPFCFFSASSGKLATYIIVCFPFVSALLVHPALEALRSGSPAVRTTALRSFDVLGWLLFVAGGIAIAVGLALPPPVGLRRFVPFFRDALPLFVSIGGAAVAGGMWIIRHRGRHALCLAGAFGFFALAGAFAALLPDLQSEKMPERYLHRLVEAAGLDPRRALFFTNGQMGHTVAWTFRRSDTRLLNSAGEMDYGAQTGEKEGRRLLYRSHDLVQLLRRPDRDPVAVFFVYDPETDLRYRWLLKFEPRLFICGPMVLLVFPPPPAAPAPRAR